jgi:hypothetical protein
VPCEHALPRLFFVELKDAHIRQLAESWVDVAGGCEVEYEHWSPDISERLGVACREDEGAASGGTDDHVCRRELVLELIERSAVPADSERKMACAFQRSVRDHDPAAAVRSGA